MRFDWRPALQIAVGIGLSLAAVACGKDLVQALLHPPVDDRVRESLLGAAGGLTVPTAMTPGNANQFRFAVFGDTQIRSENRTRLAAFAQSAAAEGIEFFIVAGDLTEDATVEQYALIRAALNGVGLPYYVALGNHDLFQPPRTGGWQSYKATFGPATYSVSIASRLKLVFIDTASGDLGARQFQWLESELAANASQPSPQTVAVISHYPIYDGAAPLMWRLSSHEERYKLMSLLERYRVAGFYAGHIHAYRESRVASIPHFTIGSMYPYVLDFGDPGYLKVTYSSGALSHLRVGL